MKNPEFLSYFNGLNKSNQKETILSNANNIVSSIKIDSNLNSEKYKSYLKIFSNPCDDLLYTVRRLIGGLSSTGLEYREGFAITLQLFLEKFYNEINFNELLEIIQKETYVPKNEKSHVKICALSGKILMYKIILNLKCLNEENILVIVKNLSSIPKEQKSLEESVIILFKELFQKIFNDYYDIKKSNKLLDGLYKLLDKICEHKNDCSKIDNNFEFSIYFILMNYVENLKGFLPNKIINNFFDNSNSEEQQPLNKYFSLLLNLPIKYNYNDKIKEANQFNLSFALLLEILTKLNNKNYSYKIWNILIDPVCVENFKKISSKNFEFLIYSYSLFLVEKFFDLSYVSQIFDESFFLSLLQFNTNKKIKYAINLTQIISEKILELDNKENEKLIKNYCNNCLEIFGSEIQNKYSPKTLRNFYIFLLRNISDVDKYISNLLSNDSDSVEEIQFNMTALKILLNEEKFLSSDKKQEIINYFIKYFYSDIFEVDITFQHNIEEMTLNLILSLIKPTMQNGKLIQMKSSAAINKLIEVHKNIIELIKNKKIFSDEEDNNNDLIKMYKKNFKNLSKENCLKNHKSKIITKLGLILLFYYLKYPEEYQEDISDLIAIIEKDFDENWMKIFTALCLNLLHKGSSELNEIVLNAYKNMSKYIGKDGLDVIVEFLKDTKIKKNKNKMESDDEDDEEEQEIENNNSSKKKKKSNEIKLDESEEE